MCGTILHGALSFGAVWLVRALSQLIKRVRSAQSTRNDLVRALRRCEEELAIVGRVHARARWAKVRAAVDVRPWVLHWIEQCAQDAEERRIGMANAGVLEGDALFVAPTGEWE